MKTHFPVVVIGPGFDMKATIRTARDFNAVIVIDKDVIRQQQKQFLQHVLTAVDMTSVVEIPLKMPYKAPLKIESIFIEKPAKPWSKQARYKRKFF